ncbi:LysR family transcriptional regulator [Sphaerisporangium rufum]|uniref:LysR family transcriptional regulator n=1 Tax=Sphaerisporangium rufum TaxID=1381558 RepID=A0A919R460_9ACTN|nr:LysR family transcriptional regulator [Sphaerisporangium rufum]GII79371.1 LysR family transcriptional regulator [Sphaerisporangium rufum]
MMELRRLRILQELHAEGTVAGAARALHLTPSAVSQQLAVLGREAGVPLLERHGRRLRLTAAGQVLLKHADAVAAQLETARSDLAAYADGRLGVERAGGFPSAIVLLLAPAAAALRRTHPDRRVEISEVETEVALPMLVRGELDIVVVMSSAKLPAADDPRIRLVELMVDPQDAALPAGHRLAGEEQVDLAALAGEDWVAPLPGTACREVLEAGCRQAGFQPRIMHGATDFSAALALVACGLGVTLIPRLIGSAGTAGVTVRPLTGPRVPVRLLYAAVRRGSGPTPLLSALCAHAATL